VKIQPWRVILVVFLVSSQVYASGEGAKKSANSESELQKAPDETKQWKNPFAGQENAWLAGKKLFKRNCAGCHGKDGRGDNEAPSLHEPPIQQAKPGQLLWFLKNGNLKEGMPAWSRLPEQQLWQLVTYLQSIQK
jgi:mono/diheme cytochrome c family protein